MPIKENERGETGTAAPATQQEHAACKGYGACSKSGCNCQGFEGSGALAPTAVAVTPIRITGSLLGQKR